MASTERQGGVDALTLGGVAALAEEMKTSSREALLTQLFNERIGPILKKVGQVTAVDPSHGARLRAEGEIGDDAFQLPDVAGGRGLDPFEMDVVVDVARGPARMVELQRRVRETVIDVAQSVCARAI